MAGGGKGDGKPPGKGGPKRDRAKGKGKTAKGDGDAPKRQKTAPWDVEIGSTVTDGRCTIIETETHIKVGAGPNVAKQDLADIIGCGPSDKCWAVALSGKPWPLKLMLCNHKDEPGHDAWDSDKHSLTAFEVSRIHSFVDTLAAAAATGE